MPTVLLTTSMMVVGCSGPRVTSPPPYDGPEVTGGASGDGGGFGDAGTGGDGTGGDGTGGDGTGGDGTGGDGGTRRVCEGDRRIRADAGFDALVAEGCEVIEGDLVLGRISNRSLDGLHGLTSVGGELRIGPTEALASLSGLESLTSVGSLHVLGNEALTGLSGLESLTSVGEKLAIGLNPLLTSLDPLHDWPGSTVSGAIEISFNPQLRQCEVESFDLSQVNAACPQSACLYNEGTGTCP